MRTKYLLFALSLVLPEGDAVTQSPGIPVSAVAASGSIIFVGTYSVGVDYGGLLRSTDNGATWLQPSSRFIVECIALDSSRVCVGTMGGLIRSTDEGASWTSLGLGEYDVTQVVPVLDTLFVVANGSICSTTDHGVTWTTLMPYTESAGCLLPISGGLLAGSNSLLVGGLFKSIDGGHTWNSAGLTGQVITALGSAGGNLLAGSTAPGGGIFLSTDDGITWNENLSSSQTIQVRKFLVADSGIFVATRNGIFRSTDEGVSWNPAGLAGVVVNDLFGPGDGMLAATNQGLYRSSNSGSSWVLVSADFTQVNSPKASTGLLAAELEQNYPNPFNPSTTIRYALAKATHVNISVFNAIGQVMITLVNAIEVAGNHEVRFDGARFASGVYIYRIQAGPWMRSKSMILLR